MSWLRVQNLRGSVASFRVAGVLGIGLCLGTGCIRIAGPSTVTLDPVTMDNVANPAGHAAVYISKVTDSRHFSGNPNDVGDPCLMNGADVDKKAVTDQTIGDYKMKADLVLSKGSTVESVVLDAVARGLMLKGYTVVDSGKGGVPVEVNITKCWTWASHGPDGLRMNAVARVKLKSDVLITGEQTVDATYEINAPFLAPSSGLAAIDNCLEGLGQNMQPVLKAP